MKQVITLKNVSKRYGKKEVIKSVNLDVQKGEFVGLIGANGVGKTTLLKIIIGMVRPTNGLGESTVVNNVSATKIGFSFKEFGPLNRQTAAKNLQIVADLFDDIDDHYLIDLLDMVGLDSKDGIKVKDYSLGMKQRLSIAMSLVGDPELIIWDEPDNALDADGKECLQEILRKLATRGKTVIVSSHDHDLLAKTMTRIIGLGPEGLYDLEEER